MPKREPATPFGPAELAALRHAPLAKLRAGWAAAFGKPPPLSLRRDLLVRAIAYHRQTQVHGALPKRDRNALLRLATLAETTGFAAPEVPRYLAPGTRLVRSWKGVVHTVEVMRDGFAWNGERFASLSAIARTITGTSWNGNAFFGLKSRRSRKNDVASEVTIPRREHDAAVEMTDG